MPNRRQDPAAGPAGDGARGEIPERSNVSEATGEPLDKGLTNPSEVWRDYFTKRHPDPETVRRLILKLHDDKRHDHVIAAIEAALITGQSQPWMYEVLALSMEIAGRPKEDIERVLLSLPDFSGSNFRSMVYSAAYLTRFGRKAQALQLYKQAAVFEPTRPEPYVLGLPLATDLRDPEAIRWTASGVLTYAWTRDHKELHRDAELALEQAALDQAKSGHKEIAESLRKTLAEAKQRDLTLTLEWAGEGELDLEVIEPAGTVCTFNRPQSPGGGVLVHDGHGGSKGDQFDRYVCAFGMPGAYTVKAKYVWGNIVGRRAKLTVTRYQGTDKEVTNTVVLPLDDAETTLQVDLAGGRRTKLATRPREDDVSNLMTRAARRDLAAGFRVIRGGDDPRARRALRRFADSRRVADAVGTNPGFQPIVTVVPEGNFLNAQAIVSADRRYVRLTLSPVFNDITDVFTFSFINNGNPGGNVGQGNPNGGGFGGPN